MQNRTRVALVALTILGLAQPAGAGESPKWPCGDRRVVLVDASPVVLRHIDAVLMRLSTATGTRWRLDTEGEVTVGTIRSLSKTWRGNTVVWANSHIVRAEVLVNEYRAIGDAEVERVLLHELAHAAGVSEHSDDPHSPLYVGADRLPADRYTAGDVERLAAVGCG